MGRGSPERLQRDLATLFRSGAIAGLTDRELIRRITRTTDDQAEAEACFEVLVERHGPMVLRVCRNVLRDPHDAEDAFQATFLVLAKRMRSIRKLDSLACWLHGVAARVSARARVEAAKRRRREREAGKLAVVSTVEDNASELQDLHVQEETLRLPERYRSVIVLCYWEGLTHEQAAQRLGCPIGTVRSRVARARELLRRRLVRRGVVPGALEAGTIPAVPLALSRITVQAAAKVAAGQVLSKVVAAHVAGLASHVARSLLMTKFQSAAVPALFILLTSIGLGYGALAPQSKPDDDKPKPEPKASAAFEAPESAGTQPRPTYREYVVEPPDLLLVEVLEALPGRPISGERLVRPDGTISLGFYGDIQVAGLTLAEVKEKVVNHLRKYLKDETLGLVDVMNRKRAEPKDTDRVFIDVTAYNSQFYYLAGEFEQPDRFHATGRDTVLDAVYMAGGLTPRANPETLVLVRKGSSGAPTPEFVVDFDAIISGNDTSTNYYLQPGDRLIANPKRPSQRAEESQLEQASAPRPASRAAAPEVPTPYFGRRSDESAKPPADGSRLQEIERRLAKIEAQLAEVLKRLDDR